MNDTNESQVRRITPESQPVFPCWLWLPIAKHHWFRLSGGLALDISKVGFTHWHPDQPHAPTDIPGAALVIDGDYDRDHPTPSP